MQFITGLNRLLRIERVIKGDDNDIADFTDTQHQADIELGQIAIQQELVDLISDRLIDYEEASTEFTSVASTTTYALATDFIRFVGQNPFLYDSANNTQVFEYPGGKDALRHEIPDYATQTGNPYYWYWEPDTTKKISLYPTPDGARTYSYDYEKDVSVTTSTDTLPFVHEIGAQAFIDASAQRFRYLRDKDDLGVLDQDPTYKSARGRLSKLLRPTYPRRKYGKKYG